MYGWTIEKGLFVIVPEIGTFFFGLGMMIGGIVATLTDDAARLQRGAALFDDLYAYFTSHPQPSIP